MADVTYLVKKSFSLEMCIISFMVVSLLLSWTTPFSRVPSLIKTMKGILISSYLQRKEPTCYCFWCMEKNQTTYIQMTINCKYLVLLYCTKSSVTPPVFLLPFLAFLITFLYYLATLIYKKNLI